MNSIINDILNKYNGLKTDSNIEISNEEIQTLIKAARIAPSADNSQIWRFLVLRDQQKKELALRCAGNINNKYACIIVALAAPFIIKHTRREQPFYMMDVPISITHILLEGIELGIHTDIIFDIDGERIKNEMKIPDKYKIVAFLGLNKYVR